MKKVTIRKKVNQMLNINETWQRLNLHKTNEAAYKEETRKAIARCKNSAAINDLVKEIVKAAVSANIDEDKIRIMVKELCSKFVMTVYLFPQKTDTEIITGFLYSLLDTLKK